MRATLDSVRRSVQLAVVAAPGALGGYTTAVVLQAAVPVTAAWLTKALLDGLTGHRAPAEPGVLVALLVGAGVLAGILPQLTAYLRDQLQRAAGLLAQDRLYAAVERFTGLARFEDPDFQDRLRLAQGSAGVSSSRTVTDLFDILAALVTLAGFLVSLSLISPVLCALLVVGALPVLAAELSMARRRAAMAWGLSPVERREFFYSGLLSSAEAAKEIRLFGAGAFLRGRMLAERTTANAVRRGQDRRELRAQGLLALLSAVVGGGALGWAVLRAYAGELTAGDVTLFLAALAGVQATLTGLALLIAQAHQQLVMFGHYLAVLDAGPDLPEPATVRPVPALRRGIELCDVWFRYADGHPWILKGVDLFIPYGGTLGLVGRNGAGKSTLVKLLCRLYDPTRGVIRWDGVDLRELDVAALRDRISTVFQDFMHYDMSATDNIAFGDPAASAEPARVIRAARQAGVHDDLAALPRGYDTLLTRLFLVDNGNDDAGPEAGVQLSGGQWQRVALARAFARTGRDLLILDEPSAGLDALAEHEIHQRVGEHRGAGTAVLISHRLGTLREADELAVLADGRIAERGSHAALMTLDGRYAELFRTQSHGYTEEPA